MKKPYGFLNLRCVRPLNKNISIFHNVYIEVLENYVPDKHIRANKYIRAKQTDFMDSKLIC